MNKINNKSTKKYLSSFISHFSSQRGYTLVELLTVISILSVIGVIVLSVIFMSLRGTQKSDAIELVRQNGDTAMSQMVRNIRYAKSLDVPASCVPATTTTSITVTSISDNLPTTFSCAANTVSSNSASLINTNAITTSACSFRCTQEKPSDSPTILIQYTLSAKIKGNISETTASIPFQSSVTMRNYFRN